MRTLTLDGRARARLALLVALGAALVLAGAAKVVHAGGTNGTVTAQITSVLNDDTTNLVKGTPTPGKNIGYTYFFQNEGSNTINHLVLNAGISGSADGSSPVGSPLYFTSSDSSVSCSGSPTLKCTDSQLVSGGSFTLLIIFSSDASAAGGDPIYPFFKGTYSPQGPPNQRKPVTNSFEAANADLLRVYTDSVNGSKTQSLALPTDGLSAASGTFTSAVSLPPSYQHNQHYAGVTLQNTPGPIPANVLAGCKNCQAFDVTTTIPLATTIDTTNNPFYDQTASNPVGDAYSWTFTIPALNGFKPSGVYHTDDNGNNGMLLPMCPVVGGVKVATADPPGICITTITFDKKHNTATYSGLGLANGHAYGT